MADLLIRDLHEEISSRLTEQAQKNGRSMNDEVKDILQRALCPVSKHPSELAAEIRKRLSGRPHSDSTPLIARDRRR